MLGDKKILVVSDSSDNQHQLAVVLDFIGEHCEKADFNSYTSLKSDTGLLTENLGLIIFDDQGEGKDLHGLLKSVHQTWGMKPTVLVGEYPQVDEAWDPYLRHMVIDRIDMPVDYNSVVNIIHRAQRFNVAQESRNQRDSRPSHLFRSLVGTSRQIMGVRKMMDQVAEKEVTVLIQGESGTGKEVVARNLHYHSSRRDHPFVPVNCGAIPAELLESELFGHEKGAFTGAVNSRAGRFEMAEGGTLFLDEIGDMPLHMQVKILRVLQEKSFERVGGNKSFQTNVRIIAATHRDLEKMIEEGSFREDLYYRLNVFPIEMPSLRDRAEDIPLLINELVSRIESEQNTSIRFNSGAILSLCQHQWAGNVRELANLVERMGIMNPYGVIGVQDLPKKYRHVEVEDADEFTEALDDPAQPSVIGKGDIALLPENGINLKEYITGLEQSLIQQALDDSGGIVARAAERLAIRRTTLVEKMRKYGMQR